MNWWKITSAPSGGADQTIRVTDNNFDICDVQTYLVFPDISDVNFRLFRSFPIMFAFQRMEIPDFSEFSDYVSFSKDGNPRLFGIFRLCFLFKGWKSPTFAMDIFDFFRHFRWRSLEKKSKQHRVDSIQRSLAYYQSTLPLRHTFTYQPWKKDKINRIKCLFRSYSTIQQIHRLELLKSAVLAIFLKLHNLLQQWK
jgi:hypothetical protein